MPAATLLPFLGRQNVSHTKRLMLTISLIRATLKKRVFNIVNYFINSKRKKETCFNRKISGIGSCFCTFVSSPMKTNPSYHALPLVVVVFGWIIVFICPRLVWILQESLGFAFKDFFKIWCLSGVDSKKNYWSFIAGLHIFIFSF